MTHHLPSYINKKSNHPPSITKNIPIAVNRRLSSISANEEVFKKAIPPYQEALKKSSYDYQLKFCPPQKTNGGKRRNSRNVTYFHSPFSLNVKTNVGARFLRLIDSCLPPFHPLAKIINRSTVKMGYCCMLNIGQAKSKPNNQIAKQVEEQQPTPGCNCRGGVPTCPVGGDCQTEGVVYQATAT